MDRYSRLMFDLYTSSRQSVFISIQILYFCCVDTNMLPKPCDVHHGCQVLRVALTGRNSVPSWGRKLFTELDEQLDMEREGQRLVPLAAWQFWELCCLPGSFTYPWRRGVTHGFIPFWVYCRFCWMSLWFFDVDMKMVLRNVKQTVVLP